MLRLTAESPNESPHFLRNVEKPILGRVSDFGHLHQKKRDLERIDLAG